MTTRQRILLFIQSFIEAHGYSPTVREIGEACAISSTSVVVAYLHQLKEFGWVSWVPGKERTLRLLKPVAVVYGRAS